MNILSEPMNIYQVPLKISKLLSPNENQKVSDLLNMSSLRSGSKEWITSLAN